MEAIDLGTLLTTPLNRVPIPPRKNDRLLDHSLKISSSITSFPSSLLDTMGSVNGPPNVQLGIIP